MNQEEVLRTILQDIDARLKKLEKKTNFLNEALIEQQEHGQLCPDTMNELKKVRA